MSDSDLFTEKSLVLSTGTVSYLESGTGDTVVFLHHSWGSIGAIRLHEILADSHHVVVPDMPGWGASERPLWARDVRDISMLVSQFLHHLGLSNVHLVGLGFGGYVAVELSCMNTQVLASQTLIGAPGLYPDEGEIMDQMMLSHRQYIVESFKDQDTYVAQFGEEPATQIRELWDHSREMTARVAWKPYFFNRRLEPMLGNNDTQTLLIWGANDKVVPISIAHQYQSQLQNVRLETLDDAGHLVELEQPEVVADLITAHVKQNS